MKRIIIAIQVFVMLLFLAKIAAVGGFMQEIGIAGVSLSSIAMAESPGKGSYRPPLKDAASDGLQKERDHATALQKRSTELDGREGIIKTEEQRLLSLKKEITDKIDILRKLEDQLNAKLETDKTVTNRKFKDMAKVYEAAPPEKAGAMLERMDVPTAAAITMNMKKDKAGIVWGHINPQRAVEITKEITRAGKLVQDEKPATPVQ